MNRAILNPKTVAVIGATDRKKSVGSGIVKNLKSNKREIYYVNHKKSKVFKKKTYKEINDIKEKIELAIIVIPQKSVEKAVDQCILKRVGAVIIISSGFAEVGNKEVQQRISRKLAEAKISLIGPNCLGIINPHSDLNASFALEMPKKGSIAFISQSGGIIDAVIDGSNNKNYGFSMMVSAGNAAGLSIEDFIRIADNDRNTNIIALYIEGVKDGKSFLNTIKEVKKSVIVLKGGKSEKAKKVIASHTGSLAGQYEVFSAALRQAGALEVDSIEEIFNLAKALSWQEKSNKNSVGIVTNGGGIGVLFVDLFYQKNINLPQKIENPLDVLGDASPDKYEESCREMIKQKNIGLLIVVQTPQIVTESLENARRIKKIADEYKKPIISVIMGEGVESKKAIKYLEKNKIPNYSDPQKTLKPVMALMNKL